MDELKGTSTDHDYFERMIQILEQEMGKKVIEVAELKAMLELQKERNTELEKEVQNLRGHIKEIQQSANELNEW